MVTAAIYLPNAMSSSGNHAWDCLAHIGQRGYKFTGLILRDPESLENCLRDRTAEVVVIGQHQHQAAESQGEPGEQATVIDLNRYRARLVTRRIRQAVSPDPIKALLDATAKRWAAQTRAWRESLGEQQKR